MVTATCDAGLGQTVIDPSGATSHFIWSHDSRFVAAWSKYKGEQGYFAFEDQKLDAAIHPIGEDMLTQNGHLTFLPGTESALMLNDTYPDKQTRMQTVYLFDQRSNTKTVLGKFYSPPEYIGEWRCDTHPRFSRDGMQVCIDSPHAGGRQMYLLDIRGAR